MGASNVKLVFGHYAGTVPPASLLALAYMALVALDSDDPPMFWGGHETIAAGAFGRRTTFGKAGSRAVERAMTPLFKAGAVAVDRHSAPGRQVRYRLNLHPIDTPRNPVGVSAEHPTESGSRSGQHPTESVPTPDGNRRTEEEEEELKQDVGSKAGVMKADLRNARTGGRAAERGDEDEDHSSIPRLGDILPARPAPPNDGSDSDETGAAEFDTRTAEGTDAARRAAAERLDAWMRENGQAG